MKTLIESKKVLLGVMTVALIFAIIVVSSFWPFIIDPSRIFTKEFFSEELIITAIVLAVTISMMFVAQAANAKKPESEIAKAKVEFKNSVEKIINHTDFHAWVRDEFQEKDRREIAIREMKRLFIPSEFYDAEDISSLDKEKQNKVIRLRKHINKLRFVNPGYYLTTVTLESSKTASEVASNENLKKFMMVAFDLLTKLIPMWVGASILISLVRDMTQDGGSSAQAWMTFFSKAFAFGSSCFTGYLMGCKMNDTDAEYIRRRVEAHNLYREARKNG